MADDLDLTRQMARVVQVFLATPSRPRFGFDLMDVLGMSSGSLYPILAKFTAAGWLRSEREDVDPAVVGRPVRRNYFLTGDGRVAAVRSLERVGQVYRVPRSQL
jgi:PadR family transcriptional regulator PadR